MTNLKSQCVHLIFFYLLTFFKDKEKTIRKNTFSIYSPQVLQALCCSQKPKIIQRI